MTRGEQAARGEGKQSLKPASSRRRKASSRRRKVSNLRGPASSRTARQAAGQPGKQPENLGKKIQQAAEKGAGKQPEISKQQYR